MTASRKPFRLQWSFSLRTLLLAVTLLALWLGYHVNWVHQRHAFLAQQFELYVAVAPVQPNGSRREWVAAWWQGQAGINVPAPWSLRLFGESGVTELSVIVHESDVTMRTWGYDNMGLPVQWPEISASRGVYRRAKQLFPEACVVAVRPEKWSIAHPGGEMSNWLRPMVISEQVNVATVRWNCDPDVVEGNSLHSQIEVTGPHDGAVIVEYRTIDGTAASRQGNFSELTDGVIFQPCQAGSHSFRVGIGLLTTEQRNAGGATFKIKLGTVIGATSKETEKTIKILPRQQE